MIFLMFKELLRDFKSQVLGDIATHDIEHDCGKQPPDMLHRSFGLARLSQPGDVSLDRLLDRLDIRTVGTRGRLAWRSGDGARFEVCKGCVGVGNHDTTSTIRLFKALGRASPCGQSRTPATRSIVA